MDLLRLAFRNVTRHRRRSAMTLLVIAFGVAALIVTGGFVRDLYRQLGETVIYSQTGHAQLAREELFSHGSRAPEKHRIPKVAALEQALLEVPGVSAVSARLSFVGLLGNGAREVPVLGEGIEPEGERPLMRSISLLNGAPLSSRDVAGAWLGEGLAAALKASPGDTVTLVASTIDGAMNTLDIQVQGVFRTFSQDYDARAIKLNLAAAQGLLATEDANSVVVLLRDDADTAVSSERLQRLARQHGLALRTWEDLNDFYRNTVLLYDRQFAVLGAIILLMVALGVNNAVNMAVLERRAEFGTMRALGNHDMDVFRLVIAEVAGLALVGSVLGMTLGSVVSLAVSGIGIDMPPPPNSNLGYVARIELVPEVFGQAFAIGVLSTLLAGIAPAYRMSRTPIVVALADAR